LQFNNCSISNRITLSKLQSSFESVRGVPHLWLILNQLQFNFGSIVTDQIAIGHSLCLLCIHANTYCVIDPSWGNESSLARLCHCSVVLTCCIYLIAQFLSIERLSYWSIVVIHVAILLVIWNHLCCYLIDQIMLLVVLPSCSMPWIVLEDLLGQCLG
jgi:hypothetical protein